MAKALDGIVTVVLETTPCLDATCKQKCKADWDAILRLAKRYERDHCDNYDTDPVLELNEQQQQQTQQDSRLDYLILAYQAVEHVCSTIAPISLTAIVILCREWIKAHPGHPKRSVRYSAPGIEAEANTIEELERIMEADQRRRTRNHRVRRLVRPAAAIPNSEIIRQLQH